MGPCRSKTCLQAVQLLEHGTGNAFGNHVDNAVRTLKTTGAHARTDIAITLFLSDPADYTGGELIVEDTFGTQSVQLFAGDLILYPASSVHRVQPATPGTRLASFFWVQDTMYLTTILVDTVVLVVIR